MKKLIIIIIILGLSSCGEPVSIGAKFLVPTDHQGLVVNDDNGFQTITILDHGIVYRVFIPDQNMWRAIRRGDSIVNKIN